MTVNLFKKCKSISEKVGWLPFWASYHLPNRSEGATVQYYGLTRSHSKNRRVPVRCHEIRVTDFDDILQKSSQLFTHKDCETEQTLTPGGPPGVTLSPRIELQGVHGANGRAIGSARSRGLSKITSKPVELRILKTFSKTIPNIDRFVMLDWTTPRASNAS